MFLCLIIFIKSSISPSSSSFLVGDAKLPIKTAAMATGYDNTTDTILLLGGHNETWWDLTTFKNNTFTNFRNFFYKDPYVWIFAISQYYTQINNDLWIIGHDGNDFIHVNIETYVATTPITTIPTTVLNSACLSSTENYLFVVGGGNINNNTQMNTTQIYHIHDNQWLTDVPLLNTPRKALSCAVVNDRLYAIGGSDGADLVFDVLDTIEVLDISNINTITNQSWRYMNDVLGTPLNGITAVVYGTDIYVVGGFHKVVGYHSYPALDVHIIDTLTEECNVFDTLNYSAWFSSSIIVRNTLYVFGGYGLCGDDCEYDEDRYQYINLLPSSNPTINPTINPIISTTEETSEEAGTADAADNVVVILIAAGAGALCICLILLFGPIYCDKRAKKYNVQNLANDVESDGNAVAVEVYPQQISVVNEPASVSGVEDKTTVDTVLMDATSSYEDKPKGDTLSGNVSKKDDEATTSTGEDNDKELMEHQFEGASVEYNVNKTGSKQVKSWLDAMGYSQYYNAFIQNGFDSMEMVKEINNIKDLEGIGVPLKAHQLKILNRIKTLN